MAKKKHKKKASAGLEFVYIGANESLPLDWEYDSTDLQPAEPPVPPTIVRELSGSRKNEELASIADGILQLHVMAVTGQQLLRYNPDNGDETGTDAGAYFDISDAAKFIESALSPSTRDKLGTKEIKEITAKLMRCSWIQADFDEFNNNPCLVNCRNGVVDIAGKLPTLVEHSSHYRFLYTIDANFIQDTEKIYCPTFDTFCATSLDGDPQKRELLLQMLGYIFSDSIAGKCALFLKGAPDSGKSVAAEFVTRLFDSSKVSHIPLHELANRFNKAQLYGKKLNVAGEIKGKSLPDITFFKEVTGGDRVQAEYKGKDSFSFRPRCKLLFSGNTLPGTSEADATKAFANRIVVLLFNRSIPKSEQDKELGQKLLDERDSIFTLAIYALHRLHRNNYQFSMPQESLDFIEAFSAAENPVQSFVNEKCILGAELSVFNVELYGAYKVFCEHDGYKPLSTTKFYALLATIPGLQRKRIHRGDESRQGFKGIALK
jgi:putative DNA primase/helicase